VARIGARRQLILGPALSAAGLLWMSFLAYGNGYGAHMLAPLAIFGLGVGTTFVPMTLTATAGVPPREAGLAAGLVNTARQVGGAVGLAALATLAASATRHGRSAAHPVQAALTAGYDRAFLAAGLVLLIGAGLALLIPAREPVPAPAATGQAASSPDSASEEAPAPPGQQLALR
jgi:MFS family permease